MIQRARLFFRESETSVAVTVGVVGGLALYYTFVAFAYGFVLPILEEGFESDDRLRQFRFTLFGVGFNYEQLVVDVVALLLLAAVGYVLFVWRGGEPDEDETSTRDCPECRSEIWVDARRCPYCTSIVVPLADAPEGS